MRTMRRLWLRLLATLRSRRAEGEFDAELEHHIAMHTEDGVRAGLSREEARRQALVRLGGEEQTRQAHRERRTLPWLETTLQDVRYAVRGFRLNPVFAVTAVLTLALGIGAATAVFSAVDRILFRPLPYADANRLVSVGLVQSLERQEFTLGGFFYEWRANQKPFEKLTFERGTDECNLTENNPVPLRCGWVSQDFLPTLGVSLAVGRNFVSAEDVPNGPRSAVISYALWTSRYNRKPDVLDKTIDLDEKPYRIIGVLPRNFEMPRLQAIDVMLPAQMDIAAQHTVNSGIGAPMWAFARLRPGVSIAQAKEAMEPLFLHTQLWIPAQIRNDFHLEVRSIRDRQMQSAYSAAHMLLGAVLVVLLIVCANVAGLFAARSAARQRELAVRFALGASRLRLVRQTLIEALLLAGAGAGAGCLLAKGLLRIFIAIAPTGVPFLAGARIDLRVIAVSVLAALACAALFGVAPSFERPRSGALGSRQSMASSRHARMRRLLVTLQIAASVVLLSGASLLLRSFRQLESQNLGLETHNVLTVSIPVTWARYPTAQAYMDFWLRVEAAMRSIPGVAAVGVSDSLPPDADAWHDEFRYADIFIDGKQASAPGTGGKVVFRKVTPDYFRVLRIPILQGYAFTEEERNDSIPPIILSALLASRLFPGGNAVGQHIQFAQFDPYFTLKPPVYTVIGVAGNVKNAGLTGQEDPEYYELRANHPDLWNRHTVMEIETALPASTMTQWVRSRVAQIDPTAPAQIDPMTETVARLADRPRFETALVAFFAFTGLVLAVIGLYGLLSYVTARRTQEIGVRMALGASRGSILRLVIAGGMRLVLFGGVIGVAAALAATRALNGLLFHVGPRDPFSFVAVSVLLLLVALLATLLPARRAASVDPSQALRSE